MLEINEHSNIIKKCVYLCLFQVNFSCTAWQNKCGQFKSWEKLRRQLIVFKKRSSKPRKKSKGKQFKNLASASSNNTPSDTRRWSPIRITQIKSQIPLFERILDHSKHQLLRCYIMIAWWNAKLFFVVVTWSIMFPKRWK